MKATLLSAVCFASLAFAQDGGMKAPIQVLPTEAKFAESPKLPKTAKIAVLEGDPTQPGLFTLRLKLAPKFELPQHTHPQDERVTVIDGVIFVKLKDQPAKKFPAGSFYVTPANMPHEVYSEEGATIQVTGQGPWVVTPVANK